MFDYIYQQPTKILTIQLYNRLAQFRLMNESCDHDIALFRFASLINGEW